MHPLRMNGAACLLIACVTIGACAQAAAPLPLKNAAPGGWSSAPVDDVRVKLAAQNAVAAQSSREGRPLELKSIAGVERQEDVPQASHRRQQPVVDHLHGGDVHGGGKRVVRRLSAVDVVVGVDRLL